MNILGRIGRAALAAWFFAVPLSEAANRAWTGAAGNGLFSDARNWGGVAPVSGDRLIFALPASATLQNDVPAAAYAGLDFAGPGEVTLTGNAITLSSDHPITANVVATPAAAGRFTIDVDLIFAAQNAVVELREGPGGASMLTFAAGRRITYGGGVAQLWATGSGSTIDVRANVSQSALTEFELRGDTFAFNGDNTFAGRIQSFARSFNVGRPTALGTPAVATIVRSGVMVLNGSAGSAAAAEYGEPFELASSELPADGISVRTAGNVALKRVIIVSTPAGIEARDGLTIDAPIISSGNLSIATPGSGITTLVDPATAFTGTLEVKSGRFRMTTPSSLAVAGLVVRPNARVEIGGAAHAIRELACEGTIAVTLGGRIRTRGPMSTSRCTLDLSPPAANFPPLPNTTYEILEPGPGLDSGGVAGLPDGGFTVVGGLNMRVSYHGGFNGNAVTLVAGPFRVGAVSGGAQAVSIGAAAAQRFVARVVDGNGAPVAGASVVFSATCGLFANESTARVTSDAGGNATSPAYFAPARSGSCTVTATLPGAGNDARTTFAVQVFDPHLNVQDLWWAGAAENGWGMSLVQHDDVVFGVLYVYDAAGNPVWYVMPGGTWNATHTTYTGPLYLPRGSPFFAYDAARFAVGAPVGQAILAFDDASSATLDYAVQGVAGRKRITRQAFGVPAAGVRSDYGDMWWGGSAQNGWGIAVLQQAGTLFSVWFTYGADGAPTWLVMPGGAWTSQDTYEGRLYRPQSSPWVGATYDAARFRVTDVGAYRLRFGTPTASFDYSVDGRAGTMPLVRQPF